jgi:arylsulfatase A-like enzyme
MKKLLVLIIPFVLIGCSLSLKTILPKNAAQNNQKAALIQTAETEENKTENPNILLIIEDDLGLDATSWNKDYGDQKPYTPNLSKLADSGRIFDNVWSNPTCSLIRTGILTGKYGVHTGAVGPLSKTDNGIDLDEVSLQSLITDKAPTPYSQAIIGKWRLSTEKNGSNQNPEKMGVPHYSGFISGSMKDYFSWTKVTNGKTKQSTTYATTEFTNDAIEWVNDQDKPWFLWLAYTAPHTPFHLPPAELLSESTLDGSDVQKNPLPYYLAAIEAMDSEIGRLLENIPEKERDNTIIIFMGDNGTPAQVVQTPFDSKSAKGSLKEGGIRVPFFVSGPNVKNGRDESLINTSDLFATIAELTGIDLPVHHNSQSFVDALFGKTESVRDFLYAETQTENKKGGEHRNNGWTVRDTHYKLIELDSGQTFLYDLQSDPHEAKNLANNDTFSDVLDRLRTLGREIRTEDQPKKSPEVVKTKNNNDFETIIANIDAQNDNISFTFDQDEIVLKTNNLPDHETGIFPTRGNPHTISAQDYEYRFPRNPKKSNISKSIKIPGVSLNGVFFEPGTAEFWDDDRNSGWNMEAFQDERNLGLDLHNAHVQPNGSYHYHGASDGIVHAEAVTSQGLVLVGIAGDGFPIYYSPDKKYQSGYELKSGNRPDGPGGKHDGTYAEDFVFTGNNDLDTCNGTVVTTDIHPDSSYAYFLTEGFPYAPRCLWGEFYSVFNKKEETQGIREKM